MVKEVHEIWVNSDASFECESHGIKGEKCIEELAKILDGLVAIEEFEKKKEFYDINEKRRYSKEGNKQKMGTK